MTLADRAGDSSSPIARGTNRAFHHHRTTTAPPEALWAQWMDVSSWKTWDLGLADAAGPIGPGSSGRIVDRGGRSAPFTVTDFQAGRHYAFETRLPLARLRVRRSIVGGAPTTFRHDVSFHGPAAAIWSAVLGPGFRRALPPTMDALAARAEEAVRC